MTLGKQTTLILAAPALLAAAAQAQTTITPLLQETDVLPHGAVTSIYNVDINNTGGWLVECDTDNASSADDNAVVLNGSVLYTEGTDQNFPASHAGLWIYDAYVDSMDINNNGDYFVLMNVADPLGVLDDTKLLIWTSGSTGTSHVLMEEGVTPSTAPGEPMGAVWLYIQEVWQNDNNQLVVAGLSDPASSYAKNMTVIVNHDGMGNLTTQEIIARGGDIHTNRFPGATGTHVEPVAYNGTSDSKAELAVNNAGQVMFYIDDEHTGAGGVEVDSHYYVDLQEIAWEYDWAPTPDDLSGNWPYRRGHLSSAEVDINDSGDWVACWDDDGPSDRDYFIEVNGVVFQQEGTPPPGIGGGFVQTGSSYGTISISDSGQITWMCDWNDPNTDIDSALYQDLNLLVQEGVTNIGGNLVDTISTSKDGRAVSDNGRFIIQELTLENGIEGAYLVQHEIFVAYCPGDGVAPHTPCPFGNDNDGSMGGCDWGNASFTSGGVLSATGSSSISAADTYLHATAVENNFGIFFEADNQVNGGIGNPLNDGLRCAGGGLVRLTSPTTATGNAASTPAAIQTLGSTAVAGSYKRYQYWFRTPTGPGGQMANLTNGIEILWSL